VLASGAAAIVALLIVIGGLFSWQSRGQAAKETTQLQAQIQSRISALTAPANAAPWVVLAWLGLGVILFIALSVRSPGRIQETATTFIEG
jgi:Na+/H+ antiporter NhaC